MPTPSYNAAGSYTLKTPFDTLIVQNATYICESIDGFEALIETGVDIHAVYYQPFELDAGIYETDLRNNESIVTLMSNTAETIYVPSSYILTFPNTLSVPYTHGFISIDLSLLPDSMNIDNLLETLRLTVDAELGIACTVKMVSMPSGQTISYTQHGQLEAARNANVQNLDNPVTALKKSQERVAELETKVAALESVIVDIHEQQ